MFDNSPSQLQSIYCVNLANSKRVSFELSSYFVHGWLNTHGHHWWSIAYPIRCPLIHCRNCLLVWNLIWNKTWCTIYLGIKNSDFVSEYKCIPVRIAGILKCSLWYNCLWNNCIASKGSLGLPKWTNFSKNTTISFHQLKNVWNLIQIHRFWQICENLD